MRANVNLHLYFKCLIAKKHCSKVVVVVGGKGSCTVQGRKSLEEYGALSFSVSVPRTLSEDIRSTLVATNVIAHPKKKLEKVTSTLQS